MPAARLGSGPSPVDNLVMARAPDDRRYIRLDVALACAVTWSLTVGSITGQLTRPPVDRPAAKAGDRAADKGAEKTTGKPDAQNPPIAVRPIVVLQTYDEVSSRLAFSSVDRNADDRLSIFEFAESHDERAAADPRDPTTFRRFDTDRDGFLNWPEFDARMQDAIRLNGEFRYRPARVIPAPKAHTIPTTEDGKELLDAQVQGLLALLDTDRSDTLSRDEFATLLFSAGMPATILTQFVQADRDGDRQLDAKELTTLTRLLPNLPRGPQLQQSARSFSVAWRRADLDGDGEIGNSELESVLRSHDPHLGRWVDKVLADADRTGDRQHGPAEVFAARRAVEDSGKGPSGDKR